MSDEIRQAAGPFRRAWRDRRRAVVAVATLATVTFWTYCYLEYWPIYRSAAILRVEPGPGEGRPDAFDVRLATLVALIAGPVVDSEVASDPKVATFPEIRGSDNAAAAVHDRSRVHRLPGTTLIEIEAWSRSATAAQILADARTRVAIVTDGISRENATRGEIRWLEEGRSDRADRAYELERMWRKALQDRDAPGVARIEDRRRIEARRRENDLARLDAASQLQAFDELVAEGKLDRGRLEAARPDLLARVRAAEILERSLRDEVERFERPGRTATDADVTSFEVQVRSAHDAVAELDRKIDAARDASRSTAGPGSGLRSVAPAGPGVRDDAPIELVGIVLGPPAAGFAFAIALGALVEAAAPRRRGGEVAFGT